MVAFEKYITIENPAEVVLSDLPFQPGQRVKVQVIVDDAQRGSRVDHLKQLLRDSQNTPGVQSISDNDIAREIAAHRASK